MLDQAGNVTAVAITGKDGTYWFDNLLDGEGLVSTTTRLPPGTFNVIIMVPGYVAGARTAPVPASGSVSLGVIELDRADHAGLPEPGR